VIAFLAWLARAGSAVNFIPKSVMIGFKSGVALHLASTQLPKLFGVKGGHDDFWERMHVFLQHIGETNTTSLLLGCAGARAADSSARSCCQTNRSRFSS
jgi:MFS superfamily sulfate permease-like transporter